MASTRKFVEEHHKNAEQEALWFGLRAPLPDHPIKSRDGLSFTYRYPEPAPEGLAGLQNWWVPLVPNYWDNGMTLGRRMFAEVVRLVNADVEAAEHALWFGIEAMIRQHRCSGVEDGFIEEVAKYAVIGMQVMASQGHFETPESSELREELERVGSALDRAIAQTMSAGLAGRDVKDSLPTRQHGRALNKATYAIESAVKALRSARALLSDLRGSEHD
ncbi:hypothetical protein [Methylococcus sp. EFPC2]|uniref:hypothetical protein n=1 Tax=Methylococcus sp. EFPC2 TaxID=2812648 RepID=UPI0019675D63|nr:hypothetical protein [Methylococcus sp. EFPC2]QSA98726.1 hypothetical protein JWZ97_08065 [Methylococcus sp. EFPC2]